MVRNQDQISKEEGTLTEARFNFDTPFTAWPFYVLNMMDNPLDGQRRYLKPWRDVVTCISRANSRQLVHVLVMASSRVPFELFSFETDKSFKHHSNDK